MQLARILIAFLALAQVTPAYAKNDKSPSGPSEVPSSSSAPRPDNGNRPEAAKAAKEPKTDARGKADKDPKDSKPPKAVKNPELANGVPANSPAALSGDQDEALRAVEAREALPLAWIVAIAEATAGVHVVNARLVRIDNVLLYQLTLLNDEGRSWRAYYLARSGNPVALN
jgi:uncharacterized membrane protein YkoI